MAIRSMELNPRFTDYYREIGICGDNGFVIFDIGARAGVERYWKSISPISKFVAFDADKDECEKLNSENGGTSNSIYYPYALHRDNKKRTFYITHFSYSCGFELANSTFIERFPNYRAVSKKDSVELESISLDSFFEKHEYDYFDFIKIDVEGSELAIFEGAKNSLKNKCVLGLKTELWWEPVIKNQPSFAEMDIYLREQGFKFFDLKLHYYSRNTLPGGVAYVDGKSNADNDGKVSVNFTPEGQALTGDAIYFRDPVHEFKTGEFTIDWNDHNILRLAGLYCIFGLYDSAIELVQFYRDKFVMNVDVDKLVNLFVPMIGNYNIPYEEYRTLSENFCKQQYASLNIPWDVKKQTEED